MKQEILVIGTDVSVHLAPLSRYIINDKKRFVKASFMYLDNGARCTETSVPITNISCFMYF